MISSAVETSSVSVEASSSAQATRLSEASSASKRVIWRVRKAWVLREKNVCENMKKLLKNSKDRVEERGVMAGKLREVSVACGRVASKQLPTFFQPYASSLPTRSGNHGIDHGCAERTDPFHERLCGNAQYPGSRFVLPRHLPNSCLLKIGLLKKTKNQWYLSGSSPLTVAGAAPVSHRFPAALQRRVLAADFEGVNWAGGPGACDFVGGR